MKNVLIIDFFLLVAIFFAVPSMAQNWDDRNEWEIILGNSSLLKLSNFIEGDIEGIKAKFDLSNAPNNSWVIMRIEPKEIFDPKVPIVFNIKADASSDLEIKMLDGKKNNTTYLRRINMKDKFKDWTSFVVYFNDLGFGWGDSNEFGKFKYFDLAFSSKSNESGVAWISGAGFGKEGMNSSFIDANASLRRDAKVLPENTSVLEWLKVVQDNASCDGILLPSRGIGDPYASTYDNAIVAMAFILKGEPKRAEKILDFYANATKRDNNVILRQNFFCNNCTVPNSTFPKASENDNARGFFQHTVVPNDCNKAYNAPDNSDRWIGDMCWLMLAYRYYDKMYPSQRYDEVEKDILDLLLKFYKSAEVGCYIQNGWIDGDTKLHEKDGHREGNIDAYAAMKLYNESEIANCISEWLDNELNFPAVTSLDLFTWSVLSGEANGSILSCPDESLRFQKTLEFQGKKVKGVASDAEGNESKSIWVDGVGHLSCAFYEAGDWEKGNFYANQMDSYLINDTIDGKQYWALPYRIMPDDHESSAISCAAWYIFAKNQFNPMKLVINHQNQSQIRKMVAKGRLDVG